MKIGLQTIRQNSNISFPKAANINLLRNYSIPTPPFILNEDKFQNSNNNEISFLGTHCGTSDFKIKDLTNIRCPVCGKITVTREQTDKFVDLVKDKKGEELAQALETYGAESFWTKKPDDNRTIYRTQKQEAVDMIKEVVRDNPEMDLKDAVNYCAYINMHSLVKEQIKVVDDINIYLYQNEGAEADKVYSILEKYTSIIKNRIPNKTFKRKDILEELKNTLEEGEFKDNVLKIARKLPSSETNINAFFVKYSKDDRTNEEIAKKLVYSAIPTAEHVVCASKEGDDEIENYFCDCADCNVRRADLHFKEWAKTIPDFDKKLHDYFATVQQNIYAGKFKPEYDFYVKDMIQKLYDLTDGEFKVEPVQVDEEGEAFLQQRREKQLLKLDKAIERFKTKEVTSPIDAAQSARILKSMFEQREILSRVC